MKKTNQKGFTVVEIVIGLAVVVALIGAGGLIYKRVGGKPFSAGASVTAFSNDFSKMTYKSGYDYPTSKIDGIVYKILPRNTKATIYTLVTSSQTLNVTQLCAHYRSFGNPQGMITIAQHDTRGGTLAFKEKALGSSGPGSVCITSPVVGVAGTIDVYAAQGAYSIPPSADIGVDAIYGLR